VRFKRIRINTHGALITMMIIFCPTNPAKTAFVTMEWIITQPHPQIAQITVILGKYDCTNGINTLIGASLANITFLANNFIDHESIHSPMQ